MGPTAGGKTNVDVRFVVVSEVWIGLGVSHAASATDEWVDCGMEEGTIQG
jgi:hypothetical protein